MELLINSNSNSNSWEILLTIAIAIVPKMSIAIVISILLISSAIFISEINTLKDNSTSIFVLKGNNMLGYKPDTDNASWYYIGTKVMVFRPVLVLVLKFPNFQWYWY